ncbi:uncharacterized protein V1518DRAFT_414390 [Limtongia smithiae]|uniref:uncharacterized protein n=1 Tax=Limtongia smithiae TaxID=1125753 RepID=UPI0034CEDEC9
MPPRPPALLRTIPRMNVAIPRCPPLQRTLASRRQIERATFKSPRVPRPRYIDQRDAVPTQPESGYYNEEKSYSDPNVETLETRVIYNPDGVLQPSDRVAYLLENPALVIERQIEYMNVFMGFEQANKYALMDVSGNQIGYAEEVDFGIMKAIARQVYRLHRPFTVNIYDSSGNIALQLYRPFSWINSYVKVKVPATVEEDERIIGEVQQSWHPWRRRYNLFVSDRTAGSDAYDQFAAIDAPVFSFTFELQDERSRLLGVVDRNWVGLGRELFTDTGVYILKMDAATTEEESISEKAPGMTLDERAVMLAAAVSIDYDYFSRHSRPGGGLFFFGGGE